MSHDGCARRSLAHLMPAMGYRLAPTVRACRTEADDLIFLDLAHDRYIAPKDAAREALLKRLDGPGIGPDPALAPLDARGLLIFEPDSLDRLHITLRGIAATTPAEIEKTSEDFPVRDLAHLAWARFRCSWELRRHGMRALQRASDSNRGNATGTAALGLVAVAARLVRARSLLPLQHSCLLDSLTLRTVLDRQGFRSEIVVGVQGRPFKAHCWVEADGLVLNDDPDALRRFTPILVS
jgi:hypothetical protein